MTTDFTIGSPHEVLPENPHTELEVTAPAPPASQTTTLTSGSDSEPLAHFRWKTFPSSAYHLLAAIQKEIQRHDLSYFVDKPPSVAQGGKGVEAFDSVKPSRYGFGLL